MESALRTEHREAQSRLLMRVAELESQLAGRLVTPTPAVHVFSTETTAPVSRGCGGAATARHIATIARAGQAVQADDALDVAGGLVVIAALLVGDDDAEPRGSRPHPAAAGARVGRRLSRRSAVDLGRRRNRPWLGEGARFWHGPAHWSGLTGRHNPPRCISERQASACPWAETLFASVTSGTRRRCRGAGRGGVTRSVKAAPCPTLLATATLGSGSDSGSGAAAAQRGRPGGVSSTRPSRCRTRARSGAATTSSPGCMRSPKSSMNGFRAFGI